MSAADVRKMKTAGLKAVEKSDWKKARECFEVLERLERNDGNWPQKTAEMCRRLGKPQDAIAGYARAAEVYARNGFLLKAIAVCRLILELDPRHTETLERLAGYHSEQKVMVKPGAALGAEAVRGGTPLARPRAPSALPEATAVVVKVPVRPLHQGTLGDLFPSARPVPDLEPSSSAMDIPVGWAEFDIEDLGGPVPPPAVAVGPPPAEGRPTVPVVFAATVPRAPSPPDPHAIVKGAFPKSPFFWALSERHLKVLIQRVRLVSLEPGQVLFSAGDPGDALYVVASGEISVRAPDEVARLDEGDFFGEIALVIDQPRTATTVAVVPTQVLAIDRDLVQALVADSPDLLRVLLRFVRDRLVATFLETSPLFGPFALEDRRALVSRFRFLEAQPGLRVLEQGRAAVGLFVLLAGQASVTRDGRRVATLYPGDVCGEMSLLARGPVTATVVTEGRAFLLQLPRADFEEVIMTYPHVLEYVHQLAEERGDRQARDEHILVL